MTRRRVVVTGLGVVSAIGNDRASFWESLIAGRHGFRKMELLETDTLQFENGAEVRDLDLDFGFDRTSREALDRFAKLWVVAAREAVEDSGVSPSSLSGGAIVTGTSVGGQTTQDELFRALYRDGRRRLTPFAVPRIMANAGASHLSTELGIEGPGLTLSTACASSSHAIGIASWMLFNGAVEVAIAGGSEAPFSLGHLKAWDGLRVIAPDVCRPFSRGRKGMILGEGGGALVLETLESARERGAEIHAELIGVGMSSDAGHLTKPSADGAARALTAALRDASLEKEEVGYINTHGTGTLLNDATETEAIHRVFEGHAAKLLTSSTKSMHGHTLGAAGALEAIATVLALNNGVIPPTANFMEPDPECNLDVVPNQARKAPIARALSSSFAFGGLNGVLAFARYPA